MAEIDPVILELRAEQGRYIAGIKSATRTVDQQLGFQERRVRKLEQQFQRSSGQISNTLKGLVGTLATAFTGRELVGLIDSFTRLQNALQVAGLQGESLARVQGQLVELSGRYGVSVEGLADLYGKATDAGRSFGANESEILKLTEATSQALLITGTNAAQASGAILGLSQALASGTVRAEEYNQVNEGGLRPLLQAAAATERFGGDINKLRSEVLAGTVTSKEFFDAIQQGSAALEGRASQATLTLSGALEALRSQLVVYFGEASKSSGATQALASAIQALADNLDRIIPALAVIATALGGRFVAGALAGSGALRALSAYAGIATTSLAGTALAARSAGAALLTAFGGPVGAAITAVTLGLGYVALNAESADDKIKRLNRTADETNAKADVLEERLLAAGVAADELGSSADTASGNLNGLTRTMEQARAKAKELEDQFGQTALRAAQMAVEQAVADRRNAEINLRGLQNQRRNQTRSGDVLATGAGNDIFANAQARVDAAKAAEAAARRQVRNVSIGIREGLDFSGNGNSPAPTAAPAPADKPKPTPRGPTGRSQAEIDARQADEIARLQAEELQAKIQLTTDASARAELQRELLTLERDTRIRQINADEELSDKQKAAQVAIVEKLYGIASEYDGQNTIVATANKSLYARQIAEEELAQQEREAADLAEERFRAQTDALRLQYDLAETEAERKAIALQIVEAEDEYLRSKLNAVKNSKVAEDVDKKRAQIALDALNATAGARRAAAGRANETEVERYLRDLNKTPAQINEALDGIAIGGLEALNDGLLDAIRGTKSLGEAFSNIADQIIADLIRIAIQQAVVKPLAESLFGGGGFLSAIGGIFGGGGAGHASSGSLSGVFGRASGGYVGPGQPVRVNEAASVGRVEGFIGPSTGGQIIPLGKMAAMQNSGQSGGVVRVMIEEAPGFAARVRTEASGVAVEVVRASAPTIIDASVSKTTQQLTRPKL